MGYRATVDPDALAAFRRDGFVIIPGLASAADLAPVTAGMAEVFGARARIIGIAGADPTDQAGFSSLLTRMFTQDRAAYIAAAKQTQHLASVHQLGLSPAMMSVVTGLGLTLPALSTRPVIHYMADQLKIEGGYHKTPIHQDWRSVQGSLDGITIWLPLFDVTANDYPLEVIPGSHRRGLLPSVDDAFGHRVEDGLVDENEFLAVTLKAGDAVFFSGFLVHRTGAVGGASVRIALSYRYNNAAEPSFVTRNYPGPYIYRPDMTLLRDGFPKAGDIERTFPTRPTAQTSR